MSKKEALEQIIFDFCREFLENPYLCYTEHGWHAYFYAKFIREWQYNKELNMGKYKICVIQKEYPTLTDLKFSRRQHWDIAVLEEKDGRTVEITEKEMAKAKRSIIKNMKLQDRLKVFAAIEFGMNAAENHFNNDIVRLVHDDTALQVKNKYVVNLVRIGDLSGRDVKSDPFKGNIPADDAGKVKVYHAVFGNDKKLFVDKNSQDII